ncbi:MAG: hypothetical protein PHY16_15790 [Methylobacter sp.]|nr:hypothetical protein [Methylobacter sp.]
MKNKNVLIKAVVLLTTIFFVGCDYDFNPIAFFKSQNVKIASGVSFDTKEFFAIDPVTQKPIPHCKHSSRKECNVVLDESNGEIQAAIKLSEKPIKGYVIKDGRRVEAEYVVIVKALYKGSECEADTSSGYLIVICN